MMLEFSLGQADRMLQNVSEMFLINNLFWIANSRLKVELGRGWNTGVQDLSSKLLLSVNNEKKLLSF